jgi:hypothetical protein
VSRNFTKTKYSEAGIEEERKERKNELVTMGWEELRSKYELEEVDLGKTLTQQPATFLYFSRCPWRLRSYLNFPSKEDASYLRYL